MSHSVSAMEMRQKLGEMLSRVSLRHEEIIIERAGKKVARLLPVEEQTRKSGGKLDFRNAAGLGKELWHQVDADEYLRKEQQEWD